MENEVYVELGEKMNKPKGRYPIVDAYINVLKAMCTEKEAAFASQLPEGAFDQYELADLYKAWNHLNSESSRCADSSLWQR